MGSTSKSQTAEDDAALGAGLERVCCPLCQADDASLRFPVQDYLFNQPDQFTLVTCNQCDLTYLNPRPKLEALGRFYPEEYFCYDPVLRLSGSPKRAMGGPTKALNQRRIAQLERHVSKIPSTSRVLDVGCGAYGFLYHLHRLRKCETLGIDFNAAVVSAIQERLGLPAQHGTLLDADLPPASFDGVAMYEYLEHEGNPVATLNEARRVTKPGGWLVVEIPNVASPLARLFGRKWTQIDAPRHLVLYTPSTIARMLEQCGYEIIGIRKLWYQWLLGLNFLVVLGARNMGKLRIGNLLLGFLASLPLLPVPWFCPEFLRVYARVPS